MLIVDHAVLLATGNFPEEEFVQVNQLEHIVDIKIPVRAEERTNRGVSSEENFRGCGGD